MAISLTQVNKIRQIVRYFETSRLDGADYGAIALLKDGPGGRRQITYGASQTTEYGKLSVLLKMYIYSEGYYAGQFEQFIGHLGNLNLPSLCENRSFLELLKIASEDPIMQQTQDRFFMVYFFNPARQWFDYHKFTLPLSLLVIYDSYVHSGSIMSFLRNAFVEKVPRDGGDEIEWITAYTRQRDHWIETHSRKILQATDYRTDSFLYAIKQGNWHLEFPFSIVNYPDPNEQKSPRILAVVK